MMIYHVKINSTQYEVEADSTANAIIIALDTYGTAAADEPDQCLTDDTTLGLCVCAEYAGEIIPVVVP